MMMIVAHNNSVTDVCLTLESSPSSLKKQALNMLLHMLSLNAQLTSSAVPARKDAASNCL